MRRRRPSGPSPWASATPTMRSPQRHASRSRRPLPDIEWLVYEELPYAVYLPEKVLEATASLRSRGFGPAAGRGYRRVRHRVGKWRAVNCYRSQLAAPRRGSGVAVNAPEQIHRLCRPGREAGCRVPAAAGGPAPTRTT